MKNNKNNKGKKKINPKAINDSSSIRRGEQVIILQCPNCGQDLELVKRCPVCGEPMRVVSVIDTDPFDPEDFRLVDSPSDLDDDPLEEL